MILGIPLIEALVAGAVAAVILTYGGGWQPFLRAWAALALIAFVGLAGPIVVG